MRNPESGKVSERIEWEAKHNERERPGLVSAIGLGLTTSEVYWEVKLPCSGCLHNFHVG
jgi:hypothetical protein